MQMPFLLAACMMSNLSPAGQPSAAQIKQLERLTAARDWARLEAIASSILNEDATSAAAHGALGEARMNLGRFPEAEVSFRRALELNPQAWGIWLCLAQVHAVRGQLPGIVECRNQLLPEHADWAAALLQAPALWEFAANASPVVDLGRLSFDSRFHSEGWKVPPYPSRAKIQGIQGDVVLSLYLDPTGRPLAARVLTGPEELRAAALFCGAQLRFPPRLLDGQPVFMKVTYPIPFKLR